MTYETDIESQCDTSPASPDSSQPQALIGSPPRSGPYGNTSRRTSCHSQSELGQWGENYAAEHVLAQGWAICERNWYCRSGELDLVAVDPDGVLVAIEVKTRSQSYTGYAAEAITPEKFRRLRRTFATYLSTCTQWYPSIRIDVIAIDCGPDDTVTLQYFAGDQL